jgi:hypothetical protein
MTILKVFIEVKNNADCLIFSAFSIFFQATRNFLPIFHIPYSTFHFIKTKIPYQMFSMMVAVFFVFFSLTQVEYEARHGNDDICFYFHFLDTIEQDIANISRFISAYFSSNLLGTSLLSVSFYHSCYRMVCPFYMLDYYMTCMYFHFFS